MRRSLYAFLFLAIGTTALASDLPNVGPGIRLVDDRPTAKSKPFVCDGCHDLTMGGCGFIFGVIITSCIMRDLKVITKS